MIDFWIFPLSTIWGAYQNQGLRGTTTAEFGNGDRSIWEGLPQFMEMVTAVFGHGYNENWER